MRPIAIQAYKGRSTIKAINSSCGFALRSKDNLRYSCRNLLKRQINMIAYNHKRANEDSNIIRGHIEIWSGSNFISDYITPNAATNDRLTMKFGGKSRTIKHIWCKDLSKKGE